MQASILGILLGFLKIKALFRIDKKRKKLKPLDGKNFTLPIN